MADVKVNMIVALDKTAIEAVEAFVAAVSVHMGPAFPDPVKSSLGVMRKAILAGFKVEQKRRPIAEVMDAAIAKADESCQTAAAIFAGDVFRIAEKVLDGAADLPLVRAALNDAHSKFKDLLAQSRGIEMTGNMIKAIPQVLGGISIYERERRGSGEGYFQIRAVRPDGKVVKTYTQGVHSELRDPDIGPMQSAVSKESCVGGGCDQTDADKIEVPPAKSEARLALEYDLRQAFQSHQYRDGVDAAIQNGPDLLLQDALQRAQGGDTNDAVRYLLRKE